MNPGHMLLSIETLKTRFSQNPRKVKLRLKDSLFGDPVLTLFFVKLVKKQNLSDPSWYWPPWPRLTIWRRPGSGDTLMAAPFGFELPDLYIPEVTMPAIRASLPCRDLSSIIVTVILLLREPWGKSIKYFLYANYLIFISEWTAWLKSHKFNWTDVDNSKAPTSN